MRIYSTVSVVVIFFLSACHEQSKKAIVVENTLNVERLDELVTIPRSTIEGMPQNQHAKGIPVVYSEKMEPIPAQTEDSNGDGKWDALLFVEDFNPNEVKSFFIYIKHVKKAPIYPKATDVYFGVGSTDTDVEEMDTYERAGDPRAVERAPFFQMEGPSWENDKVGFRIYFDPRNGIDIFGKTTDELVLSKVGVGEHVDYHTKDNWGMDVLKVGNSLGAGSIAILQHDSLFRITGKTNAMFSLIEEGPIKACFSLSYPAEEINGKSIEIIHKISIYKGQWYYKSEVIANGIEPDMALVTGIVNLKPNQFSVNENEAFFTMSSYGKQSENNDNLGMAVLIEMTDYLSHAQTEGEGQQIINTYYASMKLKPSIPNTFYFVSGWELSDDAFKSDLGFENEISRLALRLSNPLKIIL